MNTALRHSPLFDELARLGPRWTNLDGMKVATSISGNDASLAATCGVADVSFLRRFGCKGPGAAAWLAAHGIAIPAVPNTWVALPEFGLVARLGNTEFMIEEAPGGLAGQRLRDAPPGTGVYPVLRQDAALVLVGTRVPELLRQTCSMNLAELDPEAKLLAMTSMVGVGATLVPLAVPAGVAWRIWCDGTYGAYLWKTLVGIAGELGGGAVGTDVLGVA